MPELLEEHFGYLADRVKIERYQQAINRAVQPDHVVVDLGCGSGVLGLMALRAGARKVFFVEEGAVMEIARQTVTAAGFADRAEFFPVNSFQLTLPERADIVICDHVGYFGFDYGILDLLADARRRFLHQDGIVIPAEINVLLAPIESDECSKQVTRWQDGSVAADFAWVASTAANTKHAVQIDDSALLADAATLATRPLGATYEPYLAWTAEFEIRRSGRLDGVAGWFDCQIFENVRMNNSPQADDALQRSKAFLPLEEPVQVEAGESIKVTIMNRHLDHVLGWVVEFPRSGKRIAQNTFNSFLLDRSALVRAHPERVAGLNERGTARKIVLSYCDGKRTIAEVQALVAKHWPELFPTARASEQFIMSVLASDTTE